MEILITLAILIIFILVGYVIYIKRNAVYVQSLRDGKYYLVKKSHDSQEAADLLALLRNNIEILANAAYNKYQIEPYKGYMDRLYKKSKGIKITENINNSKYTSYSVEKGEELVFCIRSKIRINTIHDVNLLMYVVIHELAHIACPEYGHTPLFKDIFIKLATLAVELKIYRKIDFNKQSEEYCGMDITDSVI